LGSLREDNIQTVKAKPLRRLRPYQWVSGYICGTRKVPSEIQENVVGSFVEQTLSPGEAVNYEAKISVWSLWGYFLAGLLTIWIVGIGLLFFLFAFLHWKTTELAITNKKVIAKFGFISRTTVEILVPRIESVQVHQGIFGRIFNYGTIILSGVGTSQAPIPRISDPLRFRQEFLEIQEQLARAA
jgi:membrane protein YdbS with pleckstrin-like domain